MSSARLHKVALVGVDAASERDESLRWDSIPWEASRLAVNLHDFDTWVFFLPSFPAKVPRDSLYNVLSVDYVYNALATQTRIFVLGDPRSNVAFADYTPDRPFLGWTGYDFHWEPRGGDTVEIEDEADKFEARGYLQRIGRWNYALVGLRPSDARSYAQYVQAALREKMELGMAQLPLAVNRSGECISFALQLGLYWNDGRLKARHESIVFLPFGELEPAQALDAMLAEILGISIGQRAPRWVDELAAPGQAPIDASIRQTASEIADLEARLESKSHERERVRDCLRVLYQMGAVLEEAVDDMLRTLGADVERPVDRVGCDRYLSVVIEGVKHNAALEIKGTNRAQFDMKGFRQALQWRSEAMLARGEEHRAIFIGNSGIEAPPEKRQDPFGDGWRKQSKLHKVTALTTHTLFMAYCAKVEGTLNVGEFWKALFGTDGVFELEAALPSDEVEKAPHLGKDRGPKG